MRNRWFQVGLAFIVMTGLLAACQTVGLAVINASAPAVRRIADVPFAPGPRGRMDFYLPRNLPDSSPKPLVVFWYGGSWQTGKRGDYRFVGAALASRGAVVAIPDYRLYPEVRFPEFLRDAALAVAQAQKQAPRWGADPARIVLGGHSAGAYIAAMLALEPRYLREAGVDPDTIAGFFALSGPHVVMPDTTALHDIFDAVSTPEQYRPVARVSPGAPPALLIHGGSDDLVGADQSRKLAAALCSQRDAVALRIEPGRGHIDTLIALSRPGGFRVPGLLDQVVRFLGHPAEAVESADHSSNLSPCAPARASPVGKGQRQ